MKVLIADKFEQSGVDGLGALGCDVRMDPSLGPETLLGALAESGVEVLIVRSTKVPAQVIDGADALKLIIRAGAGHENIDSDAAGARGVPVCNCPGMNGIAVAELAMALLLSCDRRVAEQTAQLRAGRWNKAEFAKARGLKGLRLGIVGLGSIGVAFAKRALAFEMDVVAWSRSLTTERAEAAGVRFGGTSREDLLRMVGDCDAVSMHVAAAPETEGMCDTAFFEAMRDGAYFVNTSRGKVVDEDALRAAMEGKGVRAGVDVYQNQPAEKTGEWSWRLASLPGVAGCTHHVGASTDQAQQAVAEETVRIVRVFLESGKAENCVNADALADASEMVTTPSGAKAAAKG